MVFDAIVRRVPFDGFLHAENGPLDEGVEAATDIAELESVQSDLEAAMDRQDYREVLGRNEVFHFEIYSRCNMPRLLNIIESCSSASGPTSICSIPSFG